MIYIGCHLSSSKGFLHMGEEAASIGANTFQFFTRNHRGGKAKDIDPADAAALVEFMKEKQFGPIVAHAPYTLNPCGKDQKVRDFAEMAMEDDLRRMEYVPGNYYNFHPGSHVGQGAEAGIEMIAGLLNKLLKEEQTTTVLLETMAGKGSEVGRRFEELRQIIDQVELSHKVGVCLDPCHIFDGGYDFPGGEAVLEEFDKVIGLNRLKAVHVNDSMNPLGSHKDRHAKIGEGNIGLEAIVTFLKQEPVRNLPCVLETPNDLAGYGAEIALLRDRLAI